MDSNSEMKVGEVMREEDMMTKDPYQMVENIADLTVEHVRRHLSIRLAHELNRIYFVQLTIFSFEPL